MSLIVPNTAELLMLKYIVNQLKADGTASGDAGGNRVIKLYTNNLTPSEATVIGNIDEATQAGYTAVTLVGSDWTVATNSLNVSTAQYSAQTFTFTTAVTCYGYFVTDTSNRLLWLERFSTAPFALPSPGGEIAITPTLTLE